MNSGEFSAKIVSYLESNEKKLDQALLDAASRDVSMAFKRQLMEDRQNAAGKLRMSSGGHCVRKQYYSYTGEQGEPLPYRTFITFLHGDIIESALITLSKLSGWNITDEQKEVSLMGVPGHIDGILNADKKYILECKSMNEYSFERFEKDGPEETFGYLTQSSLYMEAMGLDEAIMVGCCKTTGHIADHIFKKRDDLVQKALERWSIIKDAQMPPGREHEPVLETVYNRKTKERDPTGRMILGLNCSYCQNKRSCYQDLQTDIKSGKPIFVVTQNETINI